MKRIAGPSRKRWLAVALATVLPLGGCSLFDRQVLFSENEPKNQAEAGSTHVSVLTVAPWDDFAKELQPNFTFDEAKSLELAGATTQVFEEKIIDSLKLMVELAPPQSTTTETIRKTEGLKDAAGNALPPRTSDRTDTRAPGDLSEVPDTALGSESELPTFPAGVTSPLARTLAVEPMLKYAAATALFQEIRLLNRYIEYAVQRHDYRAYAVRLQVSLMPSARNEPVDAYTTASFFLGDGNSASLAAATVLRALPGEISETRFQLESLMTQANSILDQEGPTDLRTCGSLIRALQEPAATYSWPLYIHLASKMDAGGDELWRATEKLTASQCKLRLDEADNKACEAGGKDYCCDSWNKLKGIQEIDRKALEEEVRGDCREVAWRLRLSTGPQRTPFVVPLLVTDDFELSAQARALNEARQFAFGLQVMAQGFGGNVGSARLARRLQAVTGNDFNSLMTVARVTDNSVRIRFGAVQQATAKYSMVPRTNNVTLLLLVPKRDIIDSENLGSYINVLSRTEMIHAKTGKKIPKAPLAKAETACEEILTPYRQLLEPGRPCHPELAQDLLNSVLANNFLRFKEDVGTTLVSPALRMGFPYQQLWLDFAAATTYSPYASTNFELPRKRVPEVFCDQKTALLDDGKAEATVTLRNGKLLSTGILSAALKIKGKDNAGQCVGKEHALAATQITVLDDKTSAVFKFPSPGNLGLDPDCAQSLELTCRGCLANCHSASAPPDPKFTYPLTGLKKQEVKPEAKTARFTLAPVPPSLSKPANGVATIRLLFKKNDKKEASQFGFGFEVKGARVTGVVATTGDQATPVAVTQVGNPQTWQVLTDQVAVTVDVTLEVLGGKIEVNAVERVQKIGTGNIEDGTALPTQVILVQ